MGNVELSYSPQVLLLYVFECVVGILPLNLCFKFEGQTGQVAYSATKGAIASMTLPMARDLARHGVRVVSIAPSAFSSAMSARIPEKALKSLERELVFPKR